MMFELVSVLVVVGGVVSSVVAVPDSACQANLDAWCNRPSSCPIAGRKEGNHKCGPPFFALNSSGDPSRPGQREVQWRCFAGSDLDASHMHYDGSGSCYCTHDEQLRHELCLCQHNGDQSKCPTPPTPPAPKPSPPPMTDAVTVFKAGEGGYHALNNPGLVRLRTGALLIFAEARGGHGGDGDQNDVGFKRSTSNGQTWSALRSIVPNSHGQTLGNLVPVVVNRSASEGGERVILVLCANNSLVWQIHSDDGGEHWTAPTDITPQVTLPGEGWVATGPANGIVLSSGRVLVPIDTNMAKASITIDYQLVPGSQGRNRQCPMESLRVGVRGAEPSPLPPLRKDGGSKAIVDPCTELTLGNLFKLQQRSYVMISDDNAASWTRGEALPLISSETAIGQLADGSILARARLAEGGWQDNCAAFAKSSSFGETWGPMHATLVGDPGAGEHGCIPTPGVQNSMLVRGSSVFLAGPRIYLLPSDPGHPRGNITLYRSEDGGSTWRNEALLHRGSSGYSSMVNLDGGAIGIAYCASTSGHDDGSSDILFQLQQV